MYNAVFISDVHLGTTKNAKELLKFLETIETKKLFLVGDMISFVVYKPSKELDEFFNIIKNGKWEFIYLIGNHEKENLNLQSSLAKYYKDIKLQDRYIYKYKNRTILIEHGDSFHYKDFINRAIKKVMLKSKIKLYKQNKTNYPKYRGIYYKVKPIIKFILYKPYIKYMTKQAKKYGCNTVICGHLHQPEIKKISNISYINCGDWIKNRSYVVLKSSGELELLNF